MSLPETPTHKQVWLSLLWGHGSFLLVPIVKAMVFPVIMYRCESWAVMFSNCSAGEDSRESLGPKEIKPVNPKKINPEYSLEGLMLKLKFQYFGHLMRRTD